MNHRLLWKSSPLIEWMQSWDEGRDVGHLRGECEARARGVKMVALAANPVFAAEYMERMMF